MMIRGSRQLSVELFWPKSSIDAVRGRFEGDQSRIELSYNMKFNSSFPRSDWWIRNTNQGHLETQET